LKRNLIDRVVGIFSPKAELERMRARLAVELVQRTIDRHAGALGLGYDGAAFGRRWKGTRLSNASADVIVGSAAGRLRARFRDLVRNNPQAARGVRTLVSQIIGTGIIGYPKDTLLRDEFSEWCNSLYADISHQMNFYGLQGLAMRTIVESGSVLIRRQRVKSSQMFKVPFKLQVLEPDFIDTARDELLSNNSMIKKGIEYDAFGKPVAYYLFEQHPGSAMSKIGQQYKTVRVPAEDIIHCFDVLRAGQTDGVPWGHPVLLRLQDYEDYEDAQLLRQKIAACFTGFIYDTEAPINETRTEGTDTKPMSDRFEPGAWEVLPPGKRIELATPPGVGADFEPYTTRVLQGIAAGIGCTYEQLTQDYSRVNFSSARMSFQQFFADVDNWRWNMFIPHVCSRVWSWWLEGYDLAVGLKPRQDQTIRWTPPRKFMVDPSKEVNSMKDLVRSGFQSLSETVRQLGEDPDEHFNEMAADNKLLDKLNLKLDSDPRSMTNTGQSQSAFEGNGANGDSANQGN
jgi:lambda family phage portal protein